MAENSFFDIMAVEIQLFCFVYRNTESSSLFYPRGRI